MKLKSERGLMRKGLIGPGFGMGQGCDAGGHVKALRVAREYMQVFGEKPLCCIRGFQRMVAKGDSLFRMPIHACAQSMGQQLNTKTDGKRGDIFRRGTGEKDCLCL